uniref:pentatricopeptide repeat-containing protein At3g21470 n=1 Tax=Erigeron canadensis TaxID=72917 RepID=UPI001CB952B7|nr:pentatricopeptide repeat-containing protein At3g21470 [Erigeron canadensis]
MSSIEFKDDNRWYYWCIRNHISNGKPKDALTTYTQNHFQYRNQLLNVVPLVLKACAYLSMIHFGKALHSESIKTGVGSNVVVGTSTVSMYAKCGHVTNARKLFDEMPVKNVVTWNAMIGGYMLNGLTEPALDLFDKMSEKTEVSWIEMIAGYAKMGNTDMARGIFDKVPLALKNVVTWTVMVDGYAVNGQMDAARDVFEVMPERNCFVWSSVISGYFREGNVMQAKAIFDRIKDQNLVNWNSLISGYCQNGLCYEALDAFAKMQEDGFEPDEVSFTSALSACAQLGLLETGKELHRMITQTTRINKFILNALVDMYAKCGDLTNARTIFENMSDIEKNDTCWNTMISGFSIHGHCKEALDFFDRMEKSRYVNPDEITFLSVLSCCAHVGNVKEGLKTFSKMKEYGLSGNVKHYGCLVDLLGRAGRLKEAFQIVTDMPMRPNDMVWGALLGACRLHSDLDMANQVLERVRLQATPDGSSYVLMSNIYAASERWEKAESVRFVMSCKRVPKTIGHSSVALDNS